MFNNELKLFQRSENFIWTDEHIANCMLEAHLDFEHDAASRNINTIEATIAWISRKLPKHAKVLDLGCGPGLYASLLAKRGFSVTGIDISQKSISYAINKAQEENLPIIYRCADYIKDDIGAGYDAVLCIYCDFGALIPEEQAILLDKINNALSDEGLFIFDVFRTGLCESKQEVKSWYYSEQGGFWSDKTHFILEEVKHFAEHMTWGSRTIILEEKESPKEYITWDQYYTEKSIEELLNIHGFNINSIHNELVSENEFTSNNVMFIEAKKKL